MTKLHLVDRWGRLWVVLFFAVCTTFAMVLGALRGTQIAPPQTLVLGLVMLTVIAWFYPVGRHAYVTPEGITTLRMGNTVHGKTLHKTSDIAQIRLTHGRFLDSITLHTTDGRSVLLTRTIGVLGRAPASVAKIESILGRKSSS